MTDQIYTETCSTVKSTPEPATLAKTFSNQATGHF
jgi:hypothetical protein